ncbi:MAG: type II toxin-antitoxin system HicB family antitoxin [Phycisphaerales bacterium]
MSGSSKKKSKLRIDRPFAPEILRQAKELAEKYRIVLSWEDREYYGAALEMPLVMADGKTPDECVTNTREAIVAVLAFMLEEGEEVPAGGGELKREEQVNVRLTMPEKLQIENASRREGFRGVSDFVRSASIQAARAGTNIRKRKSPR